MPVVPRANRLEAGMSHLSLTALLVHDYDEAIAWFTAKLGFRLIEDRPVTPSKRWVIVAPPGTPQRGGRLLLARAATLEQRRMIGRQAAARVFLFLETDDFAHDHAAFIAAGVRFLEPPRDEPYGTVAVF